jgi:Pentapeptide repeats (8 copies)
MTTNSPDLQREREVAAAERASAAAERASNAQKWSVRTQAGALLVTAIVAAATAVAALAAVNTVKTTQHIAEQQAIANQLGQAVTALGSNSPTAQVAGLTLLTTSVEAQLNAALTDSSQRPEANDAYTAALGVFDAYLRTVRTSGSSDPIIAEYAAKELSVILGMGPELVAVDKEQPPLKIPSIDLSLVALPGVHWAGVRFDWLASAWMPQIDLKGADLANSHWGYATLTNANLQCADLRYADLRQANLIGADLSSADLRGALLPPSIELKHVNTVGAIGPVQGLSIVRPGTSYNPDSCFSNSGR